MKNTVVLVVLCLCSYTSGVFLSSKTSSVFHTTGCRYSANLNDTNSFSYDTYQQAIDAGLRPCKICDPEPIIPPVPDPNQILPLPPVPSIITPIHGVVIQSDYCNYPFNVETVGKPIVVKEEYSMTQGEALSKEMEKCMFFSLPTYDPNSWNDPNLVVWVTPLGGQYHEKYCPHFDGVEVKIINRNTEIPAVNNATWYPASGILTWRTTPFEMGDYVAVANSDVGQTEIAAITVRPNSAQIASLGDAIDIWLQANFDYKKLAEWDGIKKKVAEEPDPVIGAIRWIFKDSRWIAVNGRERVISKTQREVIDAITIKETETKITERSMGPYSNIWEKVKKVDTEIITTEYIREEPSIPSSNVPSFEDILTPSGTAPAFYFSASASEEEVLKVKPIEPNKPVLSAFQISQEEKDSFLTGVNEEFRSLVSPMLDQSNENAQENYEKALMEYALKKEEHNEKLKDWEEAKQEWVEMEKYVDDEEEHMKDMAMRFHIDEMHYEEGHYEEEQRIEVLEWLLQDERVNEGEKAVLNNILVKIRESPLIPEGE